MSEENTLSGSVEPAMPTEATEVAPTEVNTEPTAEATTSDEGATEPEQKSESDDAKADKPKPKSRAQERIEQVTRDNKNLRRSVSRLNQEIGKLKAEKPLREEDFANPAEYQGEVFKRATREASLESQFQGAQSDMERLRNERQEAWVDRIAEASERMPDFEQVFHDRVPVSDIMAEIIVESDLGPELAYYLGKHVSDARRISQMQPVEAARELGRLEARLSPPQAKRISSAPKPVTTVSGKASAPSPRDLHALAKTGEDATAFIEESRRRRAQGA